MELQRQGEQLDRVDKTLNHMNETLHHGEKHIRNMNKFLGLWVWPWNHVRSFEKRKEYARAFLVEDQLGRRPHTVAEAGTPRGDEHAYGSRRGTTSGHAELCPRAPSGSSRSYIKHVTHDAREEEMEENLGAIHSVALDLRAQAEEMSRQLDAQAPVLDTIAEKVESNRIRVKFDTGRVNKLLHN